jgi:hypothetical protein
MSERKQREARLRNRQSGGWGTTSAMYFDAVKKVFQESEKTAASGPAKSSCWVYAGLPILIAGVEAFLIEHQHLLNDSSNTQTLAGIATPKEVLGLYPLPDELRHDFEALVEIRNQVVHPSPLPFGRPEWPDSLQRLRTQKVLDGNTPQSGADVLALLANHQVFAWAVEKCAEALDVVAESDRERASMFHGLANNLWQVLKKPAPHG